MGETGQMTQVVLPDTYGLDGLGGLEDAGGLDCSIGLIGTGGSEQLAGLGGVWEGTED